MSQDKKQKVFWKEEEQRELAIRLFARWKERPLDLPIESIEWVMENKWPSERRRKIATMSVIPITKKLFQEMVASVISKDGVEQAKEEPPGPTYEHLMEAIKGVVVEKQVPYDLRTFLSEQPTHILVQEVLHRFSLQQSQALAILERIEAKLIEPKERLGFRPVEAPIPAPVALPKKSKLYIAIAGLLNSQFQHVVQSVGTKADLYFLDANTNKPSAPWSVDHIIINRKFISHDFQDSLKHASTLNRVVLVDGGVQAVTQKVFDLISRQ